MALKNFRTYQLALNLYRQCEDLKGPRHMRDQLSRASLSVCLNLAEGSGKPMGKDRRRFYQIAMGSLREVQCCLDIAGNEMTKKCANECGASLYRLIEAIS